MHHEVFHEFSAFLETMKKCWGKDSSELGTTVRVISNESERSFSTVFSKKPMKDTKFGKDF